MSIVTVSTTAETESPKPVVAEAVKEEAKPVAAEVQAEKQDESGTSEEREEESKEADPKEGDEGESKDEPKKKQGGFQKRISKLTRDRDLAAQERDYWKEQALKGKAQPEEKKAEAVSKDANADGRPDPDTFEGTHAEYLEALTDWKIEQREKQAEAKRKQEEVKTSLQSRVEKFSQGFQTFAKEHKDAPEVMDEAMSEQPMSLAVQDILLDSENGQELSYQLAKNLDEWKRINALPPLAAARELGKFEASLSKPQKQEPKKLTNAPEPIRPVGGSGAAPKEKSIFDRDISQAEYEALREKQRTKKWGA